MVHTVGIVGVNGNVGSSIAKLLAKDAGNDKIKLVLLHREGSTPEFLSPGGNIEFRTITYDDSSNIEAAVKGIHVFIGALGFNAIGEETKIVDALAKSPDLITFVPSIYSAIWNAEDLNDPVMGPPLQFIHMGLERAKEKGVGMTNFYTGIFDLYWFKVGFLGAPKENTSLEGNKVWANEQQLRNRVPVTAVQHLAQAIARAAVADPVSIKNREYSVITFWPTGHELVDLYTKINGKQAQVKDFTKADREDWLADAANFGPVKVGYWDRWENGKWGYESDGKISDTNFDGPGLEQLARTFV